MVRWPWQKPKVNKPTAPDKVEPSEEGRVIEVFEAHFTSANPVEALEAAMAIIRSAGSVLLTGLAESRAAHEGGEVKQRFDEVEEAVQEAALPAFVAVQKLPIGLAVGALMTATCMAVERYAAACAALKKAIIDEHYESANACGHTDAEHAKLVEDYEKAGYVPGLPPNPKALREVVRILGGPIAAHTKMKGEKGDH